MDPNPEIMTQPADDSSIDGMMVPQNTPPVDSSDRKNLQIFPKDRWNFVLITFYLLGIGILLPWFFFLTAYTYWMYKFRLLPQNDTLLHDILGDDDDISDLQTVFMGYLSLVATMSSTVTLCIYPFVGRKFSLSSKMYFSLFNMFLLFVITTALVKVDTDHWQDNFFYLTLGTIMLLNFSSAILQVTIFSVASLFPPRYISAIITGLAIGGVFAAIAQIVSLWVGASATGSAFVYFIIADVFIALSFICFLITQRTKFFKFYQSQSNSAPGGSIQYEQLPSLSNTGSLVIRRVDYTVIMKKIWICAFSVWMCFFVSISLFPSVTVTVQPVSERGNVWTDTYFQPVITYLLYSSCDCLGRMLAGIIHYPTKSDWKVGTFALLRTVFIPLFMFCNAQPKTGRQHLPVLIASDVWYSAITVLFGLSNGYLANIVMIIVSKTVDPHEQEVASSFMTAFLGTGLSMGSGLGLLWVRLL
ncbi:unnamed protein product [Bemisia tabaci]|uniref:Equilibrative nucleoside transporter n=1 Tax=Bemisia tabaci TaxID=7038 RepID=A0A9P0F7X2_BEMTA|nr:unnamed protein product [Bemisia tabaci]